MRSSASKRLKISAIEKTQILNDEQQAQSQLERGESSRIEFFKANENPNMTVSGEDKAIRLTQSDMLESTPRVEVAVSESVVSNSKQKPKIKMPVLMVGSVSIEKIKEEETKSEMESMQHKQTSRDNKSKEISVSSNGLNP